MTFSRGVSGRRNAGIDGDVDEGYGGVADAFRRNFSDRNEVGAASAVFRDGRAGGRPLGRPPRRGRGRSRGSATRSSPVFSTTKGMASLAMAVAHGRGLFDLDERVASYWPEFAQNDKHDITVRQLLAHQAGLAVIDTPIDLENARATLTASARCSPRRRRSGSPAEFHGYHGQSLGWYESQLLRRVDPEGRTIGRYFADEVADPLDIEFYIGLPDEVRRRPDSRPSWRQSRVPRSSICTRCHAARARALQPGSLTGRVFRNPKILARAPTSTGASSCGSSCRRSTAPARPAPSPRRTARSRPAATTRASTRERSPRSRRRAAPAGGNRDRVLRVDTAYSFGFMKPFPILPFGSSRVPTGTREPAARSGSPIPIGASATPT